SVHQPERKPGSARGGRRVRASSGRAGAGSDPRAGRGEEEAPRVRAERGQDRCRPVASVVKIVELIGGATRHLLVDGDNSSSTRPRVSTANASVTRPPTSAKAPNIRNTALIPVFGRIAPTM